MTDISPEDRERLAKTKFGEWFDEFWDKKFKDAFDSGIEEVRKGMSDHPSAGGQQQTQQTPQSSQQQVQTRRRSLLEQCFSQTFGIGGS